MVEGLCPSLTRRTKLAYIHQEKSPQCRIHRTERSLLQVSMEAQSCRDHNQIDMRHSGMELVKHLEHILYLEASTISDKFSRENILTPPPWGDS
eukprot:gene3722-biopygen12193